MLSGNNLQDKSSNYTFLSKVFNGQTASGYMVNKKFAKILLDNLIEGEQLLSNTYKNDDNTKDFLYANDQYWKILQPYYNWYIFNPKIGKQMASYSDIVKNYVDYNI
jgi:hypothetical protein